jgi:hypothetical protein
MRAGLAEAWWARVRHEPEENRERLAAADNLAQALEGDGRYAEAERLMRRVYIARRRVLGEDHPLTLTSAGTLASSLYHQGGGGGAACDARARRDERAEGAAAARRARRAKGAKKDEGR